MNRGEQMEERESNGRKGTIRRDLPKKKKRPELKRDIQKKPESASKPVANEENNPKKQKGQAALQPGFLYMYGDPVQ